VWQASVELAKFVYTLTARFPSDERFGLIAQMRRCAVSVPSNIAEGASRRSKKEFLQFLYVARGSLSELETQLTIAEQLGFVSSSKSCIRLKIEDAFGLLNGLINSQSPSTLHRRAANSDC
jgi:four helix bundle protein